jgi:flagellar protein FliO/FliZ
MTASSPRCFSFYLKKKAGLLLALVLFYAGACHPSWAIDSNSALFSQGSSSSVTSPLQALALPDATPNPAPSFFSILLRLIFALAITLGLIYLTVLGLKLIWEKQGWNVKLDEGKPIRVLNSMHLGPRKTIQVVEVGKKLLVLGVGHEEINCLAEITDPAEVDEIRRLSSTAFPNLLNRVVRKQEGGSAESTPENIFEDSRQVMGGYLDKLKTISKRKKNKDQDGGGPGEK